MSRLTEIKQRLEAATPGPWGIERTPETNWVGPLRADGKVFEVVAPFETGNGYKPEAAARFIGDAELIANAPTDIAWLIKELDKATRIIECYERALKENLHEGNLAAQGHWDATDRMKDTAYYALAEAEKIKEEK